MIVDRYFGKLFQNFQKFLKTFRLKHWKKYKAISGKSFDVEEFTQIVERKIIFRVISRKNSYN